MAGASLGRCGRLARDIWIGHLDHRQQPKLYEPKLYEPKLAGLDQRRVDNRLAAAAFDHGAILVDGPLEQRQIVLAAARALEDVKLASVELPAVF